MPKGKDSLKPAYEPILLVRKPPAKGGRKRRILNIEGGRIHRDPGDRSGWSASGSKGAPNVALGRQYDRPPEPDAQGRWPANVILCEETAAQLDALVGDRPSTLTGRAAPSGSHANPSDNAGKSWFGAGASRVYADSGGPSRFFFCPKVSPSERAAGTSGTGTHPTLKPLRLTHHLASLLLPEGPGRLVVPYAGAGSEVIGALQAGWTEVFAIEAEPSYGQLLSERVRHWVPGARMVPHGPSVESPEDDKAAESCEAERAP